jgi:methyl-accepting chemotaxis protein
MTHEVFQGISTRWLGFLSPKRWRRRAVHECLATLPVLRAQIQEAAQQVETAVSSVCNNFQSIADHSGHAVAKAAETVGDEHTAGATVAQSIETSRATISSLLERMERAGRISALAITRMDEIEHTVAGIENLLGEVQKISFANKIVALNAKIEAVHVGALGAGFEVVAEEISRQAERTTELTDGIARRIQETRDCVHSAAGNLKEFVAEDRAQSDETRSSAETAMQVLVSVNRSAHESVAMMTSENSRLRDEISQAIMHLQFQDRFSQRVAHVAEALEKMERLLGKPGRSSAEAASLGNSLLEEVRAAYSMHDEHKAHARFGDAAAVPAADGMDVELF